MTTTISLKSKYLAGVNKYVSGPFGGWEASSGHAISYSHRVGPLSLRAICVTMQGVEGYLTVLLPPDALVCQPYAQTVEWLLSVIARFDAGERGDEAEEAHAGYRQSHAR